MAFVTKLLGKILGNKSERDIKGITPIVDKIKEEYNRISQLSHDELRAESDKLKQIIADRIKPEEDQIADLSARNEGLQLKMNTMKREVDGLSKIVDER